MKIRHFLENIMYIDCPFFNDLKDQLGFERFHDFDRLKDRASFLPSSARKRIVERYFYRLYDNYRKNTFGFYSEPWFSSVLDYWIEECKITISKKENKYKLILEGKNNDDRYDQIESLLLKINEYVDKTMITRIVPYYFIADVRFYKFLDGLLKVFNDKGELEYEIPFLEGKLDGVAKVYDDGNLVAEISFKNDQLNGYYKKYSAGALVLERNFVNGALEGVVKYDEAEFIDSLNYNYGRYFDADIVEAQYSKGKPNGVCKIYFGKKTEETFLGGEIPYIDGKVEGVCKWYYESGALASEIIIPYKKEDVWKDYYENGALRSEISSPANEEGVYKEYYESGVLKYEAPFIVEQVCEEDLVGNVKKTYVNKCNGLCKAYYESGMVVYEVLYVKYNLEDLKIFNEYGVIEKEYIQKKNGDDKKELFKEYYSNGSLYREIPFDYDKENNSVLDGTLKVYAENGELEYELDFFKGKVEKFDIEWLEKEVNNSINLLLKELDNLPKDSNEGKLKLNIADKRYEIKLADNGKDGTIQVYNEEDNTIVRELQFKNGVADGLMLEFDKTGDTVFQVPFISGKVEGSIVLNYGDNVFKVPFKNSKLNGVLKEYYEKGRFLNNNFGEIYNLREIEYKDGEVNGIAKIFRDNFNSEIVSYIEIPYLNGKIDGVVRINQMNSKLSISSVMEVPFVNGLAEGVLIEYDMFGGIKRKIPYKNGKIEGLCTDFSFDILELLEVKEESKSESEITSREEQFPCVKETTYVNGKEEGIAFVYTRDIDSSSFDKPTVLSEVPYINGKKEGVAKFYKLIESKQSTFFNSYNYYPKSYLFLEEQYENGLREGISKVYYDNGVLHKEIPFHNDCIDGVYKEYNREGKLLCEFPFKNYNIFDFREFVFFNARTSSNVKVLIDNI